MKVFHYKFSPKTIGLQNLVGDIVIIAPIKNKKAYEDLAFEYECTFNVEYVTEITFKSVYLTVQKFVGQGKNIELIFTLSEPDMEWTGFLSTYFCNNSDYIRLSLFKNKYYMRTLLLNVVKQPDFKLLDSEVTLHSMLNSYSNLIVKPLDSDSSQGVESVNQNKIPSMHFSVYNNYILEEKIQFKRMVTCDGLVVGKKIYNFFVHEYNNSILKILDCQDALVVRTSQLYNSNFNLIKQLYSECQKVISMFCSDNAIVQPFHFEWFITDDEIIFCEVGARFGGANIPKLIHEAFGIDILSEYWKLIENPKVENICSNQILFPNKIAATYIKMSNGGTLIKKPNPLTDSWILSYKCFLNIFDYFESTRNISEWLFTVTFSSSEDSYEKHIELINQHSLEFEWKK